MGNIDKAIAVHKSSKAGLGWYHKLPFGEYLRDVVYGANDGIITTFAVVAGVSGAALDPAIVVVLGLANLIADGFAMATGNYLGTKSEQDYNKLLREEEVWEVEHIPEYERAEIEEIYRKKGFRGRDLARAVSIITARKDRWVGEMMREEHGVLAGDDDPYQPVKNGAATFVAFVVAGIIPLLPYIILRGTENLLMLSIVFTGVTLFVIGSLRTIFTKRSIFRSGLEMLLVGSIAAVIAYFIGEALKGLVG